MTHPPDPAAPGRANLCAPRGGRARSAVGRRSSFSSSPSPAAPANALSRYRRKVSNHPLVACDDPAGWRRGARMNLRALAAADPDTPMRQRNCGAVPIGDQVEIRIKDGTAYYCGLETCGNVWLCPVCSAKIHHRRAAELREALDHLGPSKATRPVWSRSPFRTTSTTRSPGSSTRRRTPGSTSPQGLPGSGSSAGSGSPGTSSRLEFTWGDENGWHPHHHVLVLHDQDLGAAAIAQLHAHIHSRLAAELPRPRSPSA